MYPHTYMSCTLVIMYIRKMSGQISSVLFTLFNRMNVCLLLGLIPIVSFASASLPIFGKGSAPYKIPYNYQDIWTVVARNSSGQLFFNTDLRSRKIFIWQPNNDSILPSIFLDEEPPKVLQDPVPPITAGNLTRTLPTDIHIPHQPAVEKAQEKIPSKQRSGINKPDAPITAALERPPPGTSKSAKTDSPDLRHEYFASFYEDCQTDGYSEPRTYYSQP